MQIKRSFFSNFRRPIRLFGILLTFTMLVGLTSAVAQTITATVRGTIMDPTGAVLAGVNVTATNTATNVKTGTVTNSDGNYNIQFLPIGQYKITVAAPGFETSSIGPFTLEIDQIAKIDAKLKVGNTSVTVSVTSDVSPLMQTQDVSLGATLSANVLTTIPMNGLNFQFATLFVPGAVSPTMSSMASADGNERQTDWLGAPSFNGTRTTNNNYILDGVEINETLNNNAGYNVAPEAIQEMKVITSNADAEYGNVNGGAVLIVTKGGTNKYHGSAYGYFQDNYMSADSWNNGFNGVSSIAPFTQGQFGASFGGPIRIPHVYNGKNKLFFYGDYLGFRYHSGGTAIVSVPTAAMRTCTPNDGITTCDFSELLTPQFHSQQLYNNQVTGGNGWSTAAPYANNQIPLVNPAAKFLFALPTSILPLPNRTPSGTDLGDTGNYAGYSKSQTQNNQGDARVDYKPTDRDAIMARYSMGDSFDFASHPVAIVYFPSASEYPFRNFVASWVRTISPAVVNEFRAGVSRTIFDQNLPEDPSGEFGTSGNSKIGLPFGNQGFSGFTQMAFSSYETNMGTTAGLNEFHENNFYYGDNFTWMRGLHTIKLGVQIMRYQQNSFYPGNAGVLGDFYYSGQYTTNGTPSGGGYGLADFALDEASSASVGGVAGFNGQRQYRNGYYVQDDWKLRSNLTINLGLRYGHDQPIYEVNDKEASVDLSDMSNISVSGIQFAGKNGNSRALYNPSYIGFMPRVGFSYQVKPRLVLRGGYGMTDDLEGTGTAWRMTQNYPFLTSFSTAPTPPSGSSNGLTPLRIEDGFNLSASASQGASGQGNYFNYNAFDPHLKPEMTQQFNLAVQYLIDGKTTAQVGYVGSLSQHLAVPEEADQFTTNATAVLDDYDCSGTIAPAAPACNLVGNWGNLQVTQSEGYANYNAMQATIRHQNSNGLEYTFNYTWAKAMSDASGFYPYGGVSSGQMFFQDFRNPHGDYGPLAQDPNQQFNGYFTYQLPFGRGMKYGTGMNKILDEVIGGWKIAGDVNMYSGFPLTMTSFEAYYVNSWAAHSNHYRKMKITHRTVSNWFGTDPSAVPCVTWSSNGDNADNGTCAYGHEGYNGFGNTHDGSERAPGYRQVDLAASKTFKLTQSQNLAFRGEAFNALNLASYAPPASYLGDVNYGTLGLITGTNSTQRIFQVSMRYSF